MKNFIKGFWADLNSTFALPFSIIVLVAMLLFSVTGKAQSSVTLYFDASSTNVDTGAVASIFKNFTVDSIYGYANSLPNADGMGNYELAKARVESVLDAATAAGQWWDGIKARNIVVSGSDSGDRKVTIYISPKGSSPMADASEDAMVLADSVCTIPVVGKVEMASLDKAIDKQFRTAVVAVVSPVALNLSPRKIVGETLPKEVVTLYSLDAKDEMTQEMMRKKIRKADNHIDRQQARAIGMTNSKKLRRQMRFMLQMWIQYDAIPSANLGREGARFGNGNSYRIAATWTPAGVSAKREAIDKYGRDIPWLGWDRSAYAEYWFTHTVFGEADATNPFAHKMSYSSKSNTKGMRKMRRKKVRRKVIYFFRSLTACKRAAR